MPKFYKQNKKRIDPRYFMDELLEEASDDGFTAAGSWPKDHPVSQSKRKGASEEDSPPWASSEDPMERAKQLSQQGMASQSQTPNLGVLDGALEDGTPVATVLNMVRKQLNIPGGTAVLQKFDQLLKELGVDLGAPEQHDHEGFDPGADDMEDALGRFRDASEEDKIRKSVLGSMAKNPPSTPWSKGR